MAVQSLPPENRQFQGNDSLESSCSFRCQAPTCDRHRHLLAAAGCPQGGLEVDLLPIGTFNPQLLGVSRHFLAFL